MLTSGLKKTLAAVALVSFSTSFAFAFESYFSPKDNLETVFAEKFKASEKSIDLVIYTFSSKIVRETLLERLSKGVKVRILINSGNDESVELFVAPLQAAGASVRWVTPILHHKFAVIDGKRLINSSGNLSGGALGRSYDENLVTCALECKEQKEAFEQEFEAISSVSNLVGPVNDVTGMKSGQAGKPVGANVDGVALFTSANNFPKFDEKRKRFTTTTKELEGGEGKVDSVLVDAINRAKSEVLVATGH
ncbi:MAG: phospholipase D-like domain-containing protein, partial [Bdellovibrionota bacterium]